MHAKNLSMHGTRVEGLHLYPGVQGLLQCERRHTCWGRWRRAPQEPIEGGGQGRGRDGLGQVAIHPRGQTVDRVPAQCG